jgi:membrane protease YdiL (CAAX protease family)
MTNVENNVKNSIIMERFRFLIEVFIVFLGIFLFSFIYREMLLLFLDEKSSLYGPIYYFLRALTIIIAIPLFLYFSKLIIKPTYKSQILEEDINPIKEYLNLYKTPKENFKNQLLYGILILFIIFIPLDFLVYLLIPEMLEYTGNALTSQSTDSYLLQGYFIFLISVIIIQISVSVYEESLARGFLTYRGQEYFNYMSAVIISSLYFGLMHFAYYLNPISRKYSYWFPFIWFLQTFLVAIILSILVLKKKSLFPVIFAHALNNIISAHAVWNYLQGNDFIVVTIYLYLPLLLISISLFIWQSSKIKSGVLIVYNEIKNYFKPETEDHELKENVIIRIFIDLIIAIIIVALSLFIFGI